MNCVFLLVQKSATSDAASVVEGIGLSLVSTTPDEQSQVFMVLGEDVSKSVVSEGCEGCRRVCSVCDTSDGVRV